MLKRAQTLSTTSPTTVPVGASLREVVQGALGEPSVLRLCAAPLTQKDTTVGHLQLSTHISGHSPSPSLTLSLSRSLSHSLSHSHSYSHSHSDVSLSSLSSLCTQVSVAPLSLCSMTVEMCDVCCVILLMLCCRVMCCGWAVRVVVVVSCCAVFVCGFLFFVLSLRNNAVCTFKTLPFVHSKRQCHMTHGRF